MQERDTQGTPQAPTKTFSPPTPLLGHQPPSLPSTSLPPHTKIHRITPTLLPSYRRLITTLLPIRYPDKFYTDSTTSSLALCALWHPTSTTPKRPLDDILTNKPQLVGGIQCRLEPIPTVASEGRKEALYIQTLAVLSPYRSLGIATALLNSIIATALTHRSPSTSENATAQSHYPLNSDKNAMETSTLNTDDHHITEIYAHVWEANEDAIQWYMKRGFEVEDGVVEGYYRRLKPGGAWIVRKRVGVRDYLAAKEDGI